MHLTNIWIFNCYLFKEAESHVDHSGSKLRDVSAPGMKGMSHYAPSAFEVV